MPTGIAVAFHADKVINDGDCAKRILKIVCELQEKIKNQEADFQARLQHAVEERRHGMEEQLRVEQEPIASEAQSATRQEIGRVQSRLDEIERTLDDPATELASEIQLNRERTELQAYLKGLRYSLGEVTPQPTTVEDPCPV